MKLLISCEHGGNDIPEHYQPLFTEAQEALSSHRGWDPGALKLYRLFEPLADFSIYSTSSRLLVELNRSLHHPKLFSEYTKQLSKYEQQKVVQEFYEPYRWHIESVIRQWLDDRQKVVHISLHSFTPVMNDEVRKADIGLLYDPKRETEKQLSAIWKEQIRKLNSGLITRYNYPYLGTADGLTTYLRKQFPENYSGIELEMNQKYAEDEQMHNLIFESFKNAYKELKEAN
jgi:predicted N-formylglutamate amidohydrolase